MSTATFPCPYCQQPIGPDPAPSQCPACGGFLVATLIVEHWFYAQDGRKVGPIPWPQLQHLISSGVLGPTDMVLKQGDTRWLPVSSLPVGPPAAESAAPGTMGSADLAILRQGLPAPVAAPALAPPVPGYEILDVLGRGGMGVVYRARQVRLKRMVALKMILAGGHADRATLDRFRLEAEAVARLHHPNIVQIYEVGEENDLPYFSLEYVDGGSLAQQIRGQPQPARAAAQLVETLAKAIHHAHAQGVIHRDLKPANVLLQQGSGEKGQESGIRGQVSGGRNQKTGKDETAKGTTADPCPLTPDPCEMTPDHWIPKIADFGLAKQFGDEAGQTRTGDVMGTPHYMAPEQAAGKISAIGPATDIYALGAILYELLTGRPPFQGEGSLQVLEQVRTAEPRPPRKLQPRIPRDLETICLKCLEKEPSRRYPSAGALAEDLHRFLNFEPIHARRVRPWERVLKWMRRRPAASVALVLGVLLLAGGALAFWWLQKPVGPQARVEYRANFVDVRREPKGMGTVFTEAQARRRNLTFRLHYLGDKVLRIDAVNGALAPNRFHNRSAFLSPAGAAARRETSYLFKRDTDGNIIEETALNPRGKVVWSFRYTPNDPALGWYADRRGLPQARSRQGASHVSFSWTEEGYQREAWFLNAARDKRADDSGVFGVRREFDDRGLPRRTIFLDAQGQPTSNADGVASYVNDYDPDGNVMSMACFDPAGKPTRHRDGYHRWQAGMDAQGNVDKINYQDEKNQPLLNAAGIHAVQSKYDAQGNLVGSTFLGLNGRPLDLPFRLIHWSAQYDAWGYRREEMFFGPGTQRFADGNGVSRWTAVNNQFGEIVEQAYFNAADQPILLPAGYHAFKADFDEEGFQKEISYFGVKGEPLRLPAGYHKETALNDPDGRRLETAWFDIDGQPLAPQKNGIARVKKQYDPQGRVVETVTFGVDNQPVLVDGYARVTHRYHETTGAQLEEAYFGVDLVTPALHKDGFYKWVSQQANAPGLDLEIRSFQDAAGKPMRTKDGYAMIASHRDDSDRRLTVAYLGLTGVRLGKNGQPAFDLVMHPDGYAMTKTKYDERGRPVEQIFLGLKEELVVTKKGYAAHTRVYDPNTGQAADAYWALDAKNRYVPAVGGPGKEMPK